MPCNGSIADALFTTTQQRLLSLLFGQPFRSFFASELINLAGSGSGAVQRELKRLASSGLVTVTRIGKQKHYQANPNSPVFDELQSLIRKTVGMVEPIRGALEPLTDLIVLALVYGSVAKGTDGAASDIDLLIVGDKLTLEDIYLRLAPVETNLDRKISPTLYTSKEFADRKIAGNAFIGRLLGGEHLVLIGSDDAAPAALRFRGYRSESRYLVFQCLQHTIDLPQEQWRVLDQAHRKRNLSEYEGDMDVDEQTSLRCFGLHARSRHV